MADAIKFELVSLHNILEHNIILGQSHFIKTVEDVFEVMVNTVPGAKFGLAFCEASGERLIRSSGTDKSLTDEAIRMVESIGAGHSFIVVMKDMYPINVLSKIKDVPEVVNIFCATANPVQVVVAESDQGRGIIGVIDGGSPLARETVKDVEVRKKFLRQIGYKQ